LWLLRRQIARLKFYRRVVDIILGFWQGIKTVRRLERPGLFILHSLNIWLMYYLMTYLCFFAFAPTAGLSAMAALVVFVFGGWGVVIPSPGGMGTYHFLAQTALAMYGVSGDDGFSWANISFFSIQLGCNVLIGGAALIFLPAINRQYAPAASATP
jgi:glycosyltransferase 2 family protein